MLIRFLSTEQVIAIHELALNKFGGEEGGGHRGNEYEGVEAAVQAVKNSYYETVHELAAAYAVYIVQGHVFMDGNKRAGMFSMLTFMHNNGVPLRVAQRTIAEAMVTLQTRAESGERTDVLIQWLVTLIIVGS